MNDAEQIAETILKQLGGNRFKAMTGAKWFSFDQDGTLSFRIPKAKLGINYIRIKLGSDDLYHIEFRRIWNDKETCEIKNVLKDTANGIYFDQLEEVFTNHTGLYTRL